MIIEGAREPEIQELPIYKEGGIYLQSLSSMLPPLFLSLWMLGVGLPSGTSIGTIGGADGPTAIFVTGSFPWGLLTGLCCCIALVILGIVMSRRPE